jgi:hypothetical protein
MFTVGHELRHFTIPGGGKVVFTSPRFLRQEGLVVGQFDNGGFFDEMDEERCQVHISRPGPTLAVDKRPRTASGEADEEEGSDVIDELSRKPEGPVANASSHRIGAGYNVRYRAGEDRQRMTRGHC